MRSIAIRLGIIGAIGIGAFVARPFLSGNAGDLKVGDCFDEPAGVSATVEDVQHRPCTDPHGGEVVYVGDFAPATDTYPADVDFRAFVQAQCPPAFTSYSGIDFETDTTYDMSVLTPTTDGWGTGDRTVICYAVRVDGTPITAPLKKA
jgi:hypothetical protein